MVGENVITDIHYELERVVELQIESLQMNYLQGFTN